MDNYKALSFFLGANAPGGFVSHFDKIYDPTAGWRAYIIKGGPGTGKSSLMKRVVLEAQSRDEEVWTSPCSSDPDSLDAVVLPTLKICLIDGTSPHVVEPKYPGMCEIIVNLGDHYDCDLLAVNADRLLAAYRDNAALHQRASRYFGAAAMLLNDSYKSALECTDIGKAAKYGANLASKLLTKVSDNAGTESLRFLSAVTPRGHMFLKSGIDGLCDRVYAINDEHGAVSRTVMSAVRLVALERGYDIITCTCPLAPKEKTEHIIVPAARLGFITANRYLTYDGAERVVHARRFTDAAALRLKKQRLSFNRKAVAELLKGATETLSQAKAVHDKMEKFYIDAMDFDAVNSRVDRLIADIFG